MPPSDTRQRILDTAQRLFTERGYEATSLREIAEELGFTKAALYYHFPSKDELLVAVLEPMIALFQDLMGRLDSIGQADHPVERWADILAWLIRLVRDNEATFRLVERNREVIEPLLHQGSELFADHGIMHTVLDRTLTELDLPVPTKIRMVAALGAVTGFDDWAPGLLLSLDRETFEVEMITLCRSLLGLPAEPPARSPSSSAPLPSSPGDVEVEV